MVERMAVVETKLENIHTKVESIEKNMLTFIESADKKYASKWIEKFAYSMIITIVLAVLYGILKLVIN